MFVSVLACVGVCIVVGVRVDASVCRCLCGCRRVGDLILV